MGLKWDSVVVVVVANGTIYLIAVHGLVYYCLGGETCCCSSEGAETFLNP